MLLSPREELLQIQKSLFRMNRRRIQESIHIQEKNFYTYEKTYRRSVQNYQAISSIEEMLISCEKADIIYVGDYHTCNQSQRSFLRILKAFAKKDKNLCIGLELIHQKHQKIVDDFLKGKFSEKTFLKKIRLKERWVYDLWENFKPIFDFSRFHQIPLFGIDATSPDATLQKRDRLSAQIIAKLLQKNPSKKFFIFIGDLHIAPKHLPKELGFILKRLKIKKRELILYQNSEAIYWKLANKNLEHDVEVVRINEKSFCRLHTPPVICQQSYLNWLEHEEGEIDFYDAKHQFAELVDRISHFLKINIGKEKEKVEVYTSGDLSFLEHLAKDKRFSLNDIQVIKRQILLSESYYIPKARLVYLSNLSLNHAAEEATHFIKHICAGEEKPRAPFDAFYANILHEALGFFGSKIINHKRKCYHERDYHQRVDFFHKQKVPKTRQLEYEMALITYHAKLLEREGEALSEVELLVPRPDLFFAVTHALGYILGDYIYYALLEGHLSKSEIRHLFFDPWKGDGKPFQVYWKLLEKTRNTRIPKRM